ncbi:unnamed protein product [Protopolystoma xenopodis]|uniref:Uncharacterized protein n=1 Tax=Protopolystoma xenopodis TaxID=117903 RepID=A0A448X158_9PLAT|nr:unnamed protein product [Protopolystoma xenopodis]
MASSCRRPISGSGMRSVSGLGPNAGLIGSSSRRRVLATRQVDLAEFASALPTQTSLKVVLRLASKKLVSAKLCLTLHSFILKEGEATDEDMISLASLMSLSRQGSFNVGAGVTINEVGGLPGLTAHLQQRQEQQKIHTDGAHWLPHISSRPSF